MNAVEIVHNHIPLTLKLAMLRSSCGELSKQGTVGQTVIVYAGTMAEPS